MSRLEKSKCVFYAKYDSDGELQRSRARLVCVGLVSSLEQTITRHILLCV